MFVDNAMEINWALRVKFQCLNYATSTSTNLEHWQVQMAWNKQEVSQRKWRREKRSARKVPKWQTSGDFGCINCSDLFVSIVLLNFIHSMYVQIDIWRNKASRPVGSMQSISTGFKSRLNNSANINYYFEIFACMHCYIVHNADSFIKAPRSWGNKRFIMGTIWTCRASHIMYWRVKLVLFWVCYTAHYFTALTLVSIR
jgi:hypothetical protein